MGRVIINQFFSWLSFCFPKIDHCIQFIQVTFPNKKWLINSELLINRNKSNPIQLWHTQSISCNVLTDHTTPDWLATSSSVWRSMKLVFISIPILIPGVRSAWFTGNSIQIPTMLPEGKNRSRGGHGKRRSPWSRGGGVTCRGCRGVRRIRKG